MPAVLEILTSEDLQDFVDGRCGPEIAEAMLDLMSEDPVVSQMVYDYRRQALTLREVFAAETDDANGRRLSELVRAACRPSGGRFLVIGQP